MYEHVHTYTYCISAQFARYLVLYRLSFRANIAIRTVHRDRDIRRNTIISILSLER